jgi:ribosomal-protein-alanine N-acetyltransferase
VRLERPSRRREAEFLERVRSSRSLHRGWVTTVVTPEEYRAYLRLCRREDQESYFIVCTEDDGLVGVADLNEIVRFAQQSARLGYYGFVPYVGA